MLQKGLIQRMAACSGPHPTYKRVFEPLVLPSGVELRNRIVMGSMHTGLEEKLGPTGGLDEMAAFYAERAKGGVGLIVTGGVAPNREGWVMPMAGKLTTAHEADHHKVVTKAVHENDGKIAMQILHAGRYAYHPWAVAPSKLKAPINVFTPRALTTADVAATVADFAKTTALAKEAGYDGVELMGSEGYFINEFLAPRTNSRDDEYGGSAENRARLAVEIARECRRAVGNEGFAIIFRVSLVELVENGMAFEEAVDLTTRLETEGVDVVNTGIGWHEARVPTIATCVPRAAFAFATHKLAEALPAGRRLALCATNRINDVGVAETVLEDGADLVSMARPFLADADIVRKAFEGREDETNTCIACNQACLDHTFKLLPVSCLVNPRAGHETSLNLAPTRAPLNIAVVGAGMAGLSCATALADRGHKVTLFEGSDKIGGQFNLAANVPGKEEFRETMRYFRAILAKSSVKVRLGEPVVDVAQCASFDKVVVATGVVPRRVDIPVLPGAAAPPRVRSYSQVLRAGADPCGSRVAVVGAGGIGFDVAEFLTHADDVSFYDEWGVDPSLSTRGALKTPNDDPPKRTVYLLQRKTTPHGVSLGKTTGWIHRAALRRRRVDMMSGVAYVGLVDGALRVRKADAPPTTTTEVDLEVDDVVLCAGQVAVNDLFDKLNAAKIPAFLIGGAQKAAELDAKRAIDQGFRLAANIDTANPGDVFDMPTGWKASALDFLQQNFTSAGAKKKRSKKTL
ncbi:hypothetical protein CTAYLR_000961 [Chrysophaeum taylorii]|uniref:Uncharacterized protein n=1 Tax=Chrysophaeum taylorii TaxID=2483200 RepID=A0AAD7UFE1_9STRA|nr:hypothetical protein CTAYLR_000961 [Chrysophaeum taylorii]